ncbi:hypothetical protein H7J86_32225 [Mycobacterium hackensackense]|uniref:hypothetical protein n=1 Tax=Mycobacterium hackensackense TaxID=228909 RepID=UPI002265F805|nr:hypothetical protein [Mycobacterium hackensackense]MCV7256853.1 hypothetical protein [Mycobacterium hackensackense]
MVDVLSWLTGLAGLAAAVATVRTAMSIEDATAQRRLAMIVAAGVVVLLAATTVAMAATGQQPTMWALVAMVVGLCAEAAAVIGVDILNRRAMRFSDPSATPPSTSD